MQNEEHRQRQRQTRRGEVRRGLVHSPSWVPPLAERLVSSAAYGEMLVLCFEVNVRTGYAVWGVRGHEAIAVSKTMCTHPGVTLHLAPDTKTPSSDKLCQHPDRRTARCAPRELLCQLGAGEDW